MKRCHKAKGEVMQHTALVKSNLHLLGEAEIVLQVWGGFIAGWPDLYLSVCCHGCRIKRFVRICTCLGLPSHVGVKPLYCLFPAACSHAK